MVTLLHGAHVSPICFEVGLDTQLGHWSNFKIEYTQDKDKDKDKDKGKQNTCALKQRTKYTQSKLARPI